MNHQQHESTADGDGMSERADFEEIIWFYCGTCGEEYRLPEDEETCPFCQVAQLEALQ